MPLAIFHRDIRQTGRYFIDRKKVITDLFVIDHRNERDICTCIYNVQD